MGTQFRRAEEIRINTEEGMMEVLVDGEWNTIRNITPKYSIQGVHESVSYWGYNGVTIYQAPIITETTRAERMEREERENLMNWVSEYGLETEIIDHLIDFGHEETVEWLEGWFDGIGDADRIVSWFAE
jgi:hypothetical protein